MQKIINFTQIKSKVDAISGKDRLSPGQDEFLFNLAKETPNDGFIVDIGTWYGKSACCFGFACIGTKRKVVTIDLFPGDLLDCFLENVKNIGLQNCIEYLCGDSKKIGSKWGKPIDLLFIDGSHLETDCRSDFNHFSPWVKQGGIIAMHDVGNGICWDGPYNVWNKDIKQKLKNHKFCGNLAVGYKK